MTCRARWLRDSRLLWSGPPPGTGRSRWPWPEPGAFPAAPHARVLWCGLDGDHTALAALAASVADAVTRAGAAPPDAGRPFRPHLTLARSRGRTPADVRDLVTALSGYASPSWPVDRIQLIDSHPGGRPRYSPIGRWPLNGDTLGG